MSSALQLGNNSPETSRLWRNLAYILRRVSYRYACIRRVCQCRNTGSAPQKLAGSVYHFRTPSPGGQRPPFRGMLLAIFFACLGRIVEWNGGHRGSFVRRVGQRKSIRIDHSRSGMTRLASRAAGNGIKKYEMQSLARQQVWPNAVSPSAHGSFSVASRENARLATHATAEVSDALRAIHSNFNDTLNRAATGSALFCVTETKQERPHVQ